MGPDEFVRHVDHSLLTAEATPSQIDTLCDEAMAYNFHSVFVNPVFVGRAVRRLERSNVVVGSVAGFPLGAVEPRTLVSEARQVMDDGGREVDMVVWVGGLIAGEKKSIVESIYQVARVVHAESARGVLKVILECTALSTAQIVFGCRCAAEGEADFVKTSTGFHPSGGATVEHVRLLRRQGAPLKVKASGGIRTAESAVAMMEAGADRIGTSASVAIVRELRCRRPA